MVEAVLFDMDGVITDTAGAHAAAWKRAFDEFFETRASTQGEAFVPFGVERDYRSYVDGRPRYAGVEALLASRGLGLPYGTETDGPDANTVCGLGNRKDRYFRDWLEHHTVQAYPDAMMLVGLLRQAGVKTAVFSASRNANAVLRSAGVLGLFDVIVTGDDAAARGFPGKPDPAILVESAARLGVVPERAAVFEDATAGIEAAVRGRFRVAIGVARQNNGEALRRAGAHLIVGHLSEVTWVPDEGPVVKTLSSLPPARDREAEIRARLENKTLAAFLDYDGTLTPIVEDYTRAFLSNEARAAVAALAARCTVAVVSGRDVAGVRGLVALDSIYYAGSHGFEIEGPKGWNQRLEKGVEFLPHLDDAERQLRHQLEDIAGHAVDRKRFSIAVHYRRAVDADVSTIEAVVDRVLEQHPQLRKGRGKKVFRLQPRIDWDKGRAVLWLLEQLHLDRPDVCPVYVGDDITDEDAFRALAGRGISLVVREADNRPTAADYGLADPDDVRRFLVFLTATAARPPSTAPPRANGGDSGR